MRPQSMRLLGVMTTGFGAMLNLYAPQPVLPLLSDAFGLRAGEVAATITATALAVALVGPFAGAVSDSLGRKPVMIAALLLLALPTLASASVNDLDALLVLRFLQGVFMPAAFTAAMAYATEESPPGERGRAMTLYVAATIVGGFCGRMIGGIAAECGHWPWTFLALGSVNLAAAAVVSLCLPPSLEFRRGGGIGRTIAAIPGLLSQPKLLSAFGVGFGVLFCLVTVFTYINFHLAGAPWHLTPAQLGHLFLTYLVGVALLPLSGRITDRLGSRNTVLVALGIGMMGNLLTTMPSLAIITLGLVAVCFSAFVAQAASTRFVARNAEGRHSSAAGLYLSFYYAGGAVGAVLPGSIWDQFGWIGCVLLTLAVQVILAALVALKWREPRQADGAGR